MSARKYKFTDEWVGQRFGRLVVIEFIKYGSSKNNRQFLCQCDCGRTCTKWSANLDGDSQCRTCSRPGHSSHPLYQTWSYCQRSDPHWRFEDFLADVGQRPDAKAVLSARDPAKTLSRDNWMWTSRRENYNRRFARKITINSVSKSVREWSEICGVSHQRIRQRLAKYPPEKAILAYDAARQAVSP